MSQEGKVYLVDIQVVQSPIGREHFTQAKKKYKSYVLCMVDASCNVARNGVTGNKRHFQRFPSVTNIKRQS